MELARIRTVFTGVAGTPWYSNHYFDADAVSGGDYAAFVAAFWEAVDIVIHTSIDWTVESEFAVVEDSTGLITDVGNWPGDTGPGLAAVEPLPWANQALVNWHTGVYLAGRQLRGKTFIPGLTQAANDSGVLIVGTQTVLDAAAEQLITSANGAFRVFSPTRLTSAPITNSTVPTKIAVLRSRRD